MKGFLTALKHGRLLSWVISALCLLSIIGFISPALRPENQPEYPICDGYFIVFALVVLRRALIVGAVILGVTLGL